jgi:hypothetical protein
LLLRPSRRVALPFLRSSSSSLFPRCCSVNHSGRFSPFSLSCSDLPHCFFFLSAHSFIIHPSPNPSVLHCSTHKLFHKLSISSRAWGRGCSFPALLCRCSFIAILLRSFLSPVLVGFAFSPTRVGSPSTSPLPLPN